MAGQRPDVVADLSRMLDRMRMSSALLQKADQMLVDFGLEPKAVQIPKWPDQEPRVGQRLK